MCTRRTWRSCREPRRRRRRRRRAEFGSSCRGIGPWEGGRRRRNVQSSPAQSSRQTQFAPLGPLKKQKQHFLFFVTFLLSMEVFTVEISFVKLSRSRVSIKTMSRLFIYLLWSLRKTFVAFLCCWVILFKNQFMKILKKNVMKFFREWRLMSIYLKEIIHFCFRHF